MNLADIEQLTRKYADARERLGDLVRAMQDKLEAIKRATQPQIKALIAATSEREADLHAAIQAAPELFTQPRTHIFHGVKVGFQKGKGTIEIPDADRTLALLKKHFTDDEAAYAFIRVEESPDKIALAQLSVAELKKLGCTLTETGDQVVIRPANGEVDKLVRALLREAADADRAAATRN